MGENMERKTRWKALDIRVIVVAVEGHVDDWAAYIGAVQGDCHAEEWQDVAQNGSKLPKAIAEILFPDFKHLAYRG